MPLKCLLISDDSGIPFYSREFDFGGIDTTLLSGLLSAVICSLLPGIYMNSRAFNPVMAVCAMVIAGIYYLLKTDNFRSRRYSIVFGFCAGIGLLIKYNVLVFLGPALCIIVLSSFFRKEESGSRGKRVKNILISIVLSLAISGMFYFHPENVRLLICRARPLRSGREDPPGP